MSTEESDLRRIDDWARASIPHIYAGAWLSGGSLVIAISAEALEVRRQLRAESLTSRQVEVKEVQYSLAELMEMRDSIWQQRRDWQRRGLSIIGVGLDLENNGLSVAARETGAAVAEFKHQYPVSRLYERTLLRSVNDDL